MKQIYICEKCGAQYEDYDQASACENGHVDVYRENMGGGFETELSPRLTWKPGCRYSDRVYMPLSVWDNKSCEYRNVIAVYKFDKELPERETAEIFAAHDKRVTEENERWRREWEERKKREQEKMEVTA